VAAIVVVVRGLKLAASSDDVGLRLRAADLARRARLKTVRADMVECEEVWVCIYKCTGYAGRCEADDAELRQMIIQWKLPDRKTDKWLVCWCFDGKLLLRSQASLLQSIAEHPRWSWRFFASITNTS
jgi:hypothetical protein